MREEGIEDAAVGAVRELRLALRVTVVFEALVGETGILAEAVDFFSLMGDFKLFSAAFAGDPVEMASGLWLLCGLIGGLF